jgi:hypothetical protein
MLLLLCPATVRADVRLGRSKLLARNFNLKTFSIGGLSGDGRILTGYEKVSDTKLKAKGLAYRVWIMEFPEGCDDNPDKVKFDEVLLPITDFQQFWLATDGKTILISGNRGAKFLTIDVPSKKVTVLFDHVKGKPGFRGDPPLIQYYNGTFYVWGYFYNENDEEISRGMASLDLTKTGADIFKLAFSTKELDKLKAWYVEFVSPSTAYIITRKKGTKEDTLSYFDNNKIKELDKSTAFMAEASAANRIVYSVNRDKGVSETFVKDAVQGKSWKLNKDNKVYTYMFISRDKGDTVIVSLLDIKQNKMSLFYAMEKDDFKLKPLASWQNKSMCVVRLARYGKVYATYTGSDIYWGKTE